MAQLKTAIFSLGIVFLAFLMGGLNYGEQPIFANESNSYSIVYHD